MKMVKKVKKLAASDMAEMPISPIDALLKKLDQVAYDLETLWGAGVLQNLATPDTAARWLRVKVALDKAIEGGDYDTIKAKSESLIRGWQKLEAEAIEAGHDQTRMRGKVWVACSPDNGIEYIICKHELDAARMAALEPQHANVIYTLPQIAKLLDAQSVVNMPKSHLASIFGKTEKPFSEILEDEIPW
jgi:hypothetical protein